jgi:hypothetical protein
MQPNGAAFGAKNLTMDIQLRTNYPTRDIGREIDCEAIKRNGYHDQGIVVASVHDHRLSDWERQFLKNIGGKLYGRHR